MIAALFVEKGGVYFNRPGVDPWDEERDARFYRGQDPVVCHSPCQRWGRYWSGGPSYKGPPLRLGDDKGCFLAALQAVRHVGGVLEHPEASHAFRVFGLGRPPRAGGWYRSDDGVGWICQVEQGWYGHRARKATWLYCVNFKPSPPLSLSWGRAPGEFVRLDAGFHSVQERKRAVKTGACQRLSSRHAAATPPAFAEVLIQIAESCRRG